MVLAAHVGVALAPRARGDEASVGELALEAVVVVGMNASGPVRMGGAVSDLALAALWWWGSAPVGPYGWGRAWVTWR